VTVFAQSEEAIKQKEGGSFVDSLGDYEREYVLRYDSTSTSEGVKEKSEWFYHSEVALEYSMYTSQARRLGNHPGLRLAPGVNKGKFTLDLVFALRVGGTRENYEVIRDNGVSTITDAYLGTYFGVNLIYDLIDREAYAWQLQAGAGNEGFSTQYGSYPQPTVSVRSKNLNMGIMFKRKLKRGRKYIGITYRYNSLNYHSRFVQNALSGDMHSISISFGNLQSHKEYMARMLRRFSFW